MGIDPKQLKTFIILPILKLMDLDDESSINLIMGTAAQESQMGAYIRQHGFKYDKNGAFGIYQIELFTHDDIVYRYLAQNKPNLFSLCNRLKIPVLTDIQNLIGNFYYATAICRAKYLMIPEKLPKKDDIQGLANYWKKYYNTQDGKGTENEFINNYNKFIKHEK